MIYTVDELSKISGVSVRTLHYYDEIGLLKPSFIRENGYRCYERKKLLRLQEVLFFRELEFPLKQIKEIIDSEKSNKQEIIKDQIALLRIKKRRIEKLIITLKNTMKNQNKIKDDQLYGSLTKAEIEQYKEEVRKKYDPKLVAQSEERTKHWTKKDYEDIGQKQSTIALEMAKRMDFGVEDAQVQKLIAQHYALTNLFYDCTFEVYRGLGKLYVEDRRFTDFYDKYKKGLAQFMQKAMNYYCDTHTSEH
jgi:DNA-binding transcriptional MerR regulator